VYKTRIQTTNGSAEGDSVWLYRPQTLGVLPKHVHKIHVYFRGPYELVRHIHGNIYELANTQTGAIVKADTSQFIVRSKTAQPFNLGPITHFAQDLFHPGDVALYRPTRTTWYLVTIIADTGASKILVHYLNVNPKKHGGPSSTKLVSEVNLKYRKFSPVWLNDFDAITETYATTQPHQASPFDAYASRQQLRLKGQLAFTTFGRLSDTPITAMAAYASTSPTFDMTYSST
jgi:hypothetical protein